MLVVMTQKRVFAEWCSKAGTRAYAYNVIDQRARLCIDFRSINKFIKDTSFQALITKTPYLAKSWNLRNKADNFVHDLPIASW